MLDPADIQIVIPSRQRADLCRKTVRLFPSDRITVCVDESEVDDYTKANVGCPIVPHPPLASMNRIREWMLQHFPARCLVQCDDDVKGLWCMIGQKPRRITEPAALFQIIYNSAAIADELGLSIFTYNCIGANTRYLFEFDPFRFNRVEASFYGTIGRDIHFDTALRLHGDVDLTLTALLKERIVWMDSRFSVDRDFMTLAGGNSVNRGAGQSEIAQSYLKQKWGRWFRVMKRGARMNPVVSVQRRQTSQPVRSQHAMK